MQRDAIVLSVILTYTSPYVLGVLVGMTQSEFRRHLLHQPEFLGSRRTLLA